jgi:hypothetical protein
MNEKYVGLDVSGGFELGHFAGHWTSAGSASKGMKHWEFLGKRLFKSGPVLAAILDHFLTGVDSDPRKANQKQEDKSDRVDANRLSELLRWIVAGVSRREKHTRFEGARAGSSGSGTRCRACEESVESDFPWSRNRSPRSEGLSSGP